MDVAGCAVITGAGRGIGAALAMSLSTAGVPVGLIGRTRVELEVTARECPGRTVCAVADVTDHSALIAAFHAIESRLGPVDLLVNNAAITDVLESPLWIADAAQWWRVVETNLRGPFLTCRQVLPGMVGRGRGRVVNLNTGMGMRPNPGYSAYSVSKAALGRLTSCLAESVDSHGIAVFDVSPGFVHTGMTARMPGLAKISADRWETAEPVCRLVGEIASGRLDPLSGCHLHAVRDDLDDLLAHAGDIRTLGARTLGLLPYRPDDPVAHRAKEST